MRNGSYVHIKFVDFKIEKLLRKNIVASLANFSLFSYAAINKESYAIYR